MVMAPEAAAGSRPRRLADGPSILRSRALNHSRAPQTIPRLVENACEPHLWILRTIVTDTEGEVVLGSPSMARRYKSALRRVKGNSPEPSSATRLKIRGDSLRRRFRNHKGGFRS